MGTESIGLIKRGLNKNIRGTKKQRHILRETNHADSTPQSGLLRLRPPVWHVGAAARRDQINVPGGIRAKLLPCRKENVEAFVAVISKSADEGRRKSIDRPIEPLAGSKLFRRGCRPELFRIGTEI